MVSCSLFSTILLIATLILGISVHLFYRKNVYPELSIIKETGGSENFFNADWWGPEKRLSSSAKKFIKRRNCGWGLGGETISNCPYDDDVEWDNLAIRGECSINSVEDENCRVRKPYVSFTDVFTGLFGGSGYTGGCKAPDGQRYPYADDCKGSPNNSCCQRFDRKTGFVGGGRGGRWCMKCKNPQPEDIEFCKSPSAYHCRE